MFGAQAKVTPGGTDWLDEIFHTAEIKNIGISASGGSENGRYRLSANYLDEEGIMVYNKFQRAQARLNSEFKIGDKITLGSRINVTFDKEPTAPNDPIQRATGSSPLVQYMIQMEILQVLTVIQLD